MLPPIPISFIDPVSKDNFYRQYVHKSCPVVVRGLADSWPASRKWDFSYLQSQYGEVAPGSVRLTHQQCDFNLENGSKLSPLSLYRTIQDIEQGKTHEGHAVASPVDVFPPSFQQEYSPPDYCADGAFLRSRVFMGPAGIVTSLHQDLPENLYVMVRGRKRITLFPPESPVYRHSFWSKLPNHARTDPEHPDYHQFPKFRYAQPYIAEVAAGDTLFIPSFWWHHLRNMEASIAINFWWSYGMKLPLAWTAAMYKKVRGF